MQPLIRPEIPGKLIDGLCLTMEDSRFHLTQDDSWLVLKWDNLRGEFEGHAQGEAETIAAIIIHFLRYDPAVLAALIDKLQGAEDLPEWVEMASG